jgi:hypothetical protein
MYLERDGIDIDELGAELRGYKNLHSLVVQGRLGQDAAPLQFAAAPRTTSVPPRTFDSYQTWDGSSLYKVDFNEAGRYLSLRVLFNDYREVSLSGYDADVSVDGDR